MTKHTITATLLNEQTQDPKYASQIYYDKPDATTYLLTISSDPPLDLNKADQIQLTFPDSLFDNQTVQQLSVDDEGKLWKKEITNSVLGLSYTGEQCQIGKVEDHQQLQLKLHGLRSDRASSQNAPFPIALIAGGKRLDTKLVPPRLTVVKFPQPGHQDLHEKLAVDLSPFKIYHTPEGIDPIENKFQLNLKNRDPNKPLVTETWGSDSTPTIQMSFVYGDDVGALTLADDPHNSFSAWQIAVEQATVEGEKGMTYAWHVNQPDPGAAGASSGPVWTLQPVVENQPVLGGKSGANVTFEISKIFTQAPAGHTQLYLQYSNFPGYDNGYLTLDIEKAEPQPGILRFNADPPDVPEGQEVKLSWATFAVSKVTLEYTKGGETVQDKDLKPQMMDHVVKPDEHTTYTLIAYDKDNNPVGQHFQQDVTVIPAPPQITSFTGEVNTQHDPVTLELKWDANHAHGGFKLTGEAERHIATFEHDECSYSIPLAPEKLSDKTYTLTAYGRNEEQTATATIVWIYAWSFHPTFVAVSPNGAHVFVALDDKTIIRLDATPLGYNNKRLPLLSSPQGVQGVVATDDAIYVAFDDNTIFGYFHHAQNDSWIPLFRLVVKDNPTGVAVSPDENRLFVTRCNANKVSVFDFVTLGESKTTPKLFKEVEVGRKPVGVAVSGTRVFVTNEIDGTLSVLDASTFQPVVGSPISVGNSPHGVAVSPDGAYVFVALYGENKIKVFDVKTLDAIDDHIPVGKGPWGVAVSPDGARLFVTNHDDKTLSVLDRYASMARSR